MNKDAKKALKILFSVVVVIYIVGSGYLLKANEDYINTQGKQLNYAYEEIEKLKKDYEESDYGRLERDYFEALEQLQISNSHLNQIKMKNEGTYYQSLEENK